MHEVEGWPGAAAYCVSTGEWANRVDPTAEVMAALAPHQPPYVPASQCTVTLYGTYGPNGQPGQAYHLVEIERSSTTARVDGFFRRHAVDAAGYRCSLGEATGAWVVEECWETWIA